jgi:hypothetical protein
METALAPEIPFDARRFADMIDEGRKRNAPYNAAFERVLEDIQKAGWAFAREGLRFYRRPKHDVAKAAHLLAEEHGKDPETIERQFYLLLRSRYGWKFVEAV